MQYSSIVFTSILAALVSASPAIDPLTVTSLSPAQVSIPPSSSFAKSHSETDLETSGKRQLVRHTTVTLVNQTTTIYLHVKPSHWLYTRNCTHSEPNLETLEKRQLAGHSTAIVVNQTSTTIWLGSPITESLVTGLSPRSTLFENDETTNLCLLPGSCQTLTQTPLNKATPAITGPSLTKRPQDDMDSHHVTMSTLYLVSKHVRTCLSSTQTFHQNGSVSACLHGAVYDQAHPTSSLYATIKPALETFSSKEILFTESLTSVYRYTAPPPHGAFVSALAEIALIGTVWETGRYKQTWESLSATTIYRPTCRWTTRFHGDNKPTWTDTMSDCQPSSVPETTSIWMPYMTVTTTSYPPDLVTAYASAESAYIMSLMSDPAFVSLTMEIATDTSALAAFTSAAGAIATISPGKLGGLAAVSSLIAQLPSPVASFYNSVLSQDVAIASSVINNVGNTKGASTGVSTGTNGSTKTSGTGSATGSATGTAAAAASGTAASTVSGSGAAPTNAIVKAAGVAIGVFGAAVAML